jgi:hypothetical protein
LGFKRLKTKNFITLILKSNKKRLLIYELIWIDSEKVFNEVNYFIEKYKIKREKILVLGFEPFFIKKLLPIFKEVTVVCNDINLIEATKDFTPELWENENLEIYYWDFYDFLKKNEEHYNLIVLIVKPIFKQIFLSRKFLLLMKKKADFVIINNDKPPLKKKTKDFLTESLLRRLEELKEQKLIKNYEVLNNTVLFY